MSLPSFLSAGNAHATNPAIASVPTPPLVAETTGPSHCATTPLSKLPTSLEHSINTEFTAVVRPRSPSGVRVWMSTCRTTTLMLSSAPPTASASIVSQNDVLNPNTIMQMPKWFPVVIGIVLFTTAVVVATNLAVDMMLRWLDPRLGEADG